MRFCEMMGTGIERQRIDVPSLEQIRNFVKGEFILLVRIN